MSKIKIFSLGGLNENGKNMYVIEIDKNIFVIDAGLKYADEHMLGIDYIIPNIEYLKENKKRKPREWQGLAVVFLDPFAQMKDQKKSPTTRGRAWGCVLPLLVKLCGREWLAVLWVQFVLYAPPFFKGFFIE